MHARAKAGSPSFPNLLDGASLDGVFVADLDARPKQGLGQVLDVHTKEVGDFLDLVVGHGISEFRATGLGKAAVAEMEDAGNGLEQALLLVLGEAHDVE